MTIFVYAFLMAVLLGTIVWMAIHFGKGKRDKL